MSGFGAVRSGGAPDPGRCGSGLGASRVCSREEKAEDTQRLVVGEGKASDSGTGSKSCVRTGSRSIFPVSNLSLLGADSDGSCSGPWSVPRKEHDKIVTVGI